MKKTLISVIMSCFVMSVQSQTLKQVSFEYDLRDFDIAYNRLGEMVISSSNIAAYPSESTQPCLPLLTTRLYISPDTRVGNVSYTTHRTLLASGVTISPSIVPQPSNHELNAQERLQPATYAFVSFPSENLLYTNTENIDGYDIADFLVCPFQYDGRTRNLYFIHQFDVSISLLDNNVSTSSRTPLKSLQRVRSLVVNPDEATEREIQSLNDTDIQYVILTCDSLSEAFKPLAEWKRVKGINSKIISIEHIDSTYNANCIQDKIKLCLQDYKENHGMVYAMLGGDDTIIPVRYCYMPLHNRDIPTDMFYACFNGNFEWNADCDNIYGEVSDEIDLNQNISLTRLPVRTQFHVTNAINKIIQYEQGIFANGYNNKILMAGWDLYKNSPTDLGDRQSDAKLKGDLLYEDYIQPYWDGERVRLYDTYTDIPNLNFGDFGYWKPSYIQQELSKGYSFADFITHGDQYRWESKYWPYYLSSNAESLTNSGYTIITTIACNSNGFDTCPGDEEFQIDPCLSEAFIRNPDSGVIAYLGCSREGWISPGYYPSYPNVKHGYSLQYEDVFYELAFGNDNINSFGDLVKYTKQIFIPNCNNSFYRWLQFGINPIGDPEMPVFTRDPAKFTHFSVGRTELGIFKLTADVDSCKFCLSSSPIICDPRYRIFRDTNQFESMDILDGDKVCITKDHYIPKLLNFKSTIQNENIDSDIDYVGNFIKIGNDVDSNKILGDVSFSSGRIQIAANETLIEGGTTIEVGAELIISKDLNYNH